MRTQCCGVMEDGQCTDCPQTAPTRPVYQIPHFLRSEQERFIREPDHDRRIGRGDDFAGDAWRDLRTGEIKYVAVGHRPTA